MIPTPCEVLYSSSVRSIEFSSVPSYTASLSGFSFLLFSSSNVTQSISLGNHEIPPVKNIVPHSLEIPYWIKQSVFLQRVFHIP